MPTSAPSIASLATIRRQFPALKRRHGGLPVAHFDGPGGTQVPKPVITAVSDYLAHHNANTHWAFPTSNETDAMLAGARQIVGDFLNASPAEVAFGANMTTLTFHLARALGRGWEPGDEVVVTELDHHGNVAPWESLARERGISLRTLPLSPGTGTLDLSLLESLLTSRTRLVAIGAASNALGTITDVRRAADLAHAAGARCFVDAVHYAPHALVDVRALDCDFLACSAYKFYGPHIGILYGRLDLLEELDVPKLRPAPDTAPERLETGTQNHEGIAGAAAAVEFLAGLGQGTTRRERLAVALAGLHARSERLLRRLWRGLGKLPFVTLHGPRPGTPRTPTVAFTVLGRSAEEVARHLASLSVFVSHGDFYAATVVERLGLAGSGLVRAGCACYTSPAEVDRLVAGVAALG
jgi:cysteine desulfurase family protein (TIGR01976 family)